MSGTQWFSEAHNFNKPHPRGEGKLRIHRYTVLYITQISIYTMEHYSFKKRNAFESVLMRWMNLEPIIQSEVSQKEKDKYCILTHIYRI